jgi:putative transcriptional regulator
MLDLKNHFLIAMPDMEDVDFARSVIYLFDHGKNGAAGIIINRPGDTSLKLMFDRMDMTLRREDLQRQPVYHGGPVSLERGFILHAAQNVYEPGDAVDAAKTPSLYASTLAIPGGLEITTSRDVLEAMGSGAGPAKAFVTLGYAAWQAGQLELEIQKNDWLTVTADHRLIFETPAHERYKAALALLGIDEVMLTSSSGMQ